MQIAWNLDVVSAALRLRCHYSRLQDGQPNSPTRLSISLGVAY